MNKLLLILLPILESVLIPALEYGVEADSLQISEQTNGSKYFLLGIPKKKSEK